MMDFVDPNGCEGSWVISENGFDTRYLGKWESVLCLGNGYLGLRAATEERYLGEKRGLFVAGTFDRFDESEVSELPNGADILGIGLELNGERFGMPGGEVLEYDRSLCLKTGELVRRILWESGKTGRVRLVFKRFVSLEQLHLIGQRIEITPLDQDLEVKMSSGIDAQVTNSGVQHFIEGEKRLLGGKCLQLTQTTRQSKIDFVVNLVHSPSSGGGAVPCQPQIYMERRKILNRYMTMVHKESTWAMEKLASVHTSRDREWLDREYSLEELQRASWQELIRCSDDGYDALLQESTSAWQRKVWSRSDIRMNEKNALDQLAVRFALYHLTIMTPAHDSRMNIAAKGLSGEGYKGHTFWDTEIFMLPYFVWTQPEIARSLLEYRYLSLEGARRKARENGYEGAMFPWESAWIDEGETTPVWGAADIVTGLPTKIWSGFIEQHITSDVAYGIWYYFLATGDQDFMIRCGYEIIFDAAKFWASRLEWDEERKLYCIHDVVGPDEYKEHVNNNAYTNYTAHWTIGKAMKLHDLLKENYSAKYLELRDKLDLIPCYGQWSEKKDRIYLPRPNPDGVIPQDDTYLSKRDIDLTPYRNQKHVGEIFRDYNLEQVNEMQVSKQADVLLLLYLFENLFDRDVKHACWNYYFPRTLHDSSLSLSIHSILANDMGDRELAYALFKRAAEVDLGPDMESSNDGIHAASMGGIWQCVVCGFAGVRMAEGRLRIHPRLPEDWDSVQFSLQWHSEPLSFLITHETIEIRRESCKNPEVPVEIQGRTYQVEKELRVCY